MKRHGHSFVQSRRFPGAVVADSFLCNRAHIWRGKMAVYGGTSGFSLELGYVHHSSVHIFDFETQEWTTLATEGVSPTGTESHSSILEEDCTTPAPEQFKKRSDPPPPSLRSRLVLFVWGGRNAEEFNESSYILDLQKLRWTKVTEFGDRPAPRCCVCADTWRVDKDKCRVVLVGGYGPRYFWGAEDLTEFEEHRDMFGRIHLKATVEPFLRYKDVYFLDFPIGRE